MPTISRTYPAAWVVRMEPAVESKIAEYANSMIVKKILQIRGVSSVDELTSMQKAETLIDAFMWLITSEYESATARDAAYADALNAALNDFTLGE